MAAGLSIKQSELERFQQAFETVTRELLTEADLQAAIETDGGLHADDMNLATAQLLSRQVWGQGFNEPLFFDRFNVVNQRVLKEKHLKLLLEKDQKRFDAIYFNFADNNFVDNNFVDILPHAISAVYSLDVNEYKGLQTVQLMLKHIELKV